MYLLAVWFIVESCDLAELVMVRRAWKVDGMEQALVGPDLATLMKQGHLSTDYWKAVEQ